MELCSEDVLALGFVLAGLGVQSLRPSLCFVSQLSVPHRTAQSGPPALAALRVVSAPVSFAFYTFLFDFGPVALGSNGITSFTTAKAGIANPVHHTTQPGHLCLPKNPGSWHVHSIRVCRRNGDQSAAGAISGNLSHSPLPPRLP